MKKNVLSFLIFSTCVVLDIITKKIAPTYFEIRVNNGLVLGSFSEAPEILRTVSLCSFFGVIFSIYISLLYLLPSGLIKLRIAISFFIGGVAGNSIDRIARGYSVDFISFPFGLFEYTFFNIADIFLWMGFTSIAYLLFFKKDEIWYLKNQRSKLFIYKKEQTHFILKNLFLICSCSLILWIMSFTFLKTLLKGSPEHFSSSVIAHYNLAFFSFFTFFSVVTLVASFYTSHKYAGPVFAFKNYISRLENGDDSKFLLRESDYFKELEKIASSVRKKFSK